MNSGKAITCPACGGTVEVRAAGYTVSLACRYCGALLDVANPDVRVIAEYGEALAQLSLPLGSRGTLSGVEWEVIGWQERQGSEAAWTEYLLFNPYAGYRWLVHAEGQWQFGTMMTDQPRAAGDGQVVWHGRTFRLSEGPDTITTTRVLGEFYWRVRAGETVGASAYLNGGDTLSLEHNADEINWTRLVALRPSAVRSAFSSPPPDDNAPPPDVPPPDVRREGWRARWANMPFASDNDETKMMVIAIALLVLIFVGMQALGRVTQAIANTSMVTVDGPAVEKTIGTITIDRPSQAVTLHAVTDTTFVNAWIDLDYALVNRATQQAIRADGTIEYYQGYDSDGPWTEGTAATQATIARVPRGTYDVIAQAQAHHWTDPKAAPTTPGAWDGVITDTHEVWFTGQVGGMEWGVYFTVLVLMITPPALLLYWQAKRG